MAGEVASIQGLKAQLAFTPDVGSTDDTLLQNLLDAALSYIESAVGFAIEERFGGPGQDPIPAALSQAVLQLAAHWWDQRGHDEAAAMMKTAPIWIEMLWNEFRDWAF